MAEMVSTSEDKRERAIRRLKEKDDFKVHLVVYVVVNSMLVVMWAVIGWWFFWPIFPIAAWGIGLIMHGYTVYRGTSFSEAQIRKEMDRLG